VLAEQSLWGHFLLIQDVHKGDRILAQTCSKNHYFVIFGDLVDEFAAARPNVDEDVVDSAFDIDW